MTFWQVTLDLLEGFKLTCLLFVCTLVFALPLGLIIAFCSTSKFKPLSYVTQIIVWIVRGVPLMVQIFIIYFVPGLLLPINPFAELDKFFLFNMGFVDIGKFIAVTVAFSLNYACYFSVIYRGGIESISQGQYEAGQVLGMTKKQIFSKVILLQVVKRIIPPMSNEIITLVKDTALANVIVVAEIAYKANLLLAKSMIWPIFYSAVFYLVFVGVLTLLFNWAEKKLNYFKS